MAIPDFQSFFKPLLEIAADGNEHSLKTARELIAQKMSLSDGDLKELLPSGTQKKFDNRVAWAKTYFVQAKVLESSKRGYFRITERGRELFKKGHEKIDVKILNQYPEFVEFHTAKTGKPGSDDSPGTESPVETPEETLHKAYQSIRNDLAGEILEKVKSNSPQFFEKLVVDLMVAMGYGGSRSDAGQSIGHSGDEGVDGIIKEDRLGLDVIYLQAKNGRVPLADPKSRNSLGHCMANGRRKGYFLRQENFPKMPFDTLRP